MSETGSQIPPSDFRRRRSLTGPIVLIGLGIIFLIATLHPEFDIWPVLASYWPLILIFIGVGQIWDYYWRHSHPDDPRPRGFSGTAAALVLLILFCILAAWHGRSWAGGRWGMGERHWDTAHEMHDTQSVELQGAKSVHADLQMPAGTLVLAGGSSHLLDADFRYDHSEGRPNVDYQVNGDQGTLDLTQDDTHTHFAGRENDWNLRFGGGVPLDLKLDMGAGQSDLRTDGLDLTNLEINMGAGELHLDLTGQKRNLRADVEGGVGSATIRLPKDVGVRVEASGGLGSINAHGLQRDGDAYVNDVYGKAPGSIDLTIEGGVGEINLVAEK
jgi:hypothetical protein